ncbi:hypothetical protein HK405_005458, partial [Cladochytrium tenue]
TSSFASSILAAVSSTGLPVPAAAAAAAAAATAEPDEETAAATTAVVEDDPDRCAVCLDEFETGCAMLSMRRCGHSYHAPCLTEWLMRCEPGALRCPLCNQPAVAPSSDAADANAA